MGDSPTPPDLWAPGPVELRPEEQERFARTGRWSEAVVDERIAAQDARMAGLNELKSADEIRDYIDKVFGHCYQP